MPLPLRYTTTKLWQRWDELKRRVTSNAPRIHFRLALLLLSSGFDDHEDDPSGGGAFMTEDFRELSTRLRRGSTSSRGS